MNLTIASNKKNERASRVWYDTATGLLYVLFDSIARAIALDRIPPSDFESQSDIERFSLGRKGAVVVCHHTDGEETWLPVDMWLPGGFTPPVPSDCGRRRKQSLPKLASDIVSVRRKSGLTQPAAARASGLPLRTIQQWEQGRQKPTKDRLESYLKALRVAPSRVSG